MGKLETGSISFDVAARHRNVLGDGPRIAPISNDDIDDEFWDLVNRVRASAGAGPTDVMPEYMRTMIKHPAIIRALLEMGTTLFQGRLTSRERELAILRCSWLCRAPFIWGEHVLIGKRVGLTDEEVVRVTQGSSAPGWSEHEAAILRGVEELISDQALSDKTWDILAKSWNEQQLIEFPVIVGQFAATTFIHNTLRTRLDNHAGLASR